MKYFSPSYWFKLWVLSAPLFQDKTQGINAMSIDNNQKIKDWASNNTDLQSINQELNFTNNTISNSTNIEIDHFYENFLKTQGWSKDPQIAGQQLIEIQEQHHHFLEAQHKKSRNRIKRGVNSNRENAIEFKQNWWTSAEYGVMYASFTPKFWEEIGYLKGTSNNREQFIQSFKNKVTSGVWKDDRLEGPIHDPSYKGMEGLGGSIWDNWSSINNVWQQSSKTEMMRIDVEKAHSTKLGEYTFNFKGSRIRGDSETLKNKYLDNLKRVFPDWNKEIINLGMINYDYIDNTPYIPILGSLKEVAALINKQQKLRDEIQKKYPNFDVNQISIVDNENFSHFCKCFKFKIRINENSENYSHGDLKPTFSFITPTKLNELSTIILNDSKVKQWIEHINDWNSSLFKIIDNWNPAFAPIRKNWNSTFSQIINSNSSSQAQNGYVSKSGYTLEELRNQRYNFDFQQAQINYQRNQNLNDYTKANQRFVQAQNDYILHIQQGQPLISSTNQEITLRPQPKTFTNEELYNWKRQEKETIKGYIRDWSYIHTLIEHEWKIEELNKNVEGLKSSFDNIKNQMDELDKRVTDLEKPGSNCETIAWSASGLLGTVALFPIPGIHQVATVTSALAGGVAAICGINSLS